MNQELACQGLGLGGMYNFNDRDTVPGTGLTGLGDLRA